jgi:hypothetical protein
LWPAILLTSALFVAAHVMNVITTGQLGDPDADGAAQFPVRAVPVARGAQRHAAVDGLIRLRLPDEHSDGAHA